MAAITPPLTRWNAMKERPPWRSNQLGMQAVYATATCSASSFDIALEEQAASRTQTATLERLGNRAMGHGR
jgi:hypothetical protein